MKKIAICIINYNGSQDTIECIKSIIVYEQLNDKEIFILDNSSESYDFVRLKEYLEGLKEHAKVAIWSEKEVRNDENNDIVLIKGEHNYGFAKGNNKLIEIALQRKYEYVALLNNDTVLTAPLFLNCVKAFELNPSYSIFTANICYFHSAKTWNAGGIIFAGYHKYFTTKYINKRRKRRLIPTQFVSGCFFIAKSEIFKKYGGLSERFFFGEEDYEFSYRMKKNKIKMGVLTSETLYHKIGSSVGKKSNTDQIGRKLVYYLNKYIDTKTFYSSQLWFFWRLLSNSLIFIKNIRKIGIQGTVVFLETLNHLAKTRNALDFNATFKIWEINTLDELKQLKKYSIEEEHQCR